MVLRALFRPPQSTSVQKAVAPLLDAEEEVLRDKAAAVLGKVSLLVGMVTSYVTVPTTMTPRESRGASFARQWPVPVIRSYHVIMVSC